MNRKWQYFIMLNIEDTLNNLVEDATEEWLLLGSDYTYAKHFDSIEELNQWVRENTNLQIENEDYKIETQYLEIQQMKPIKNNRSSKFVYMENNVNHRMNENDQLKKLF